MAALIALVVFPRRGRRGSDDHVARPDSQSAEAIDADLARRQQQAEALLSNIQTASPAPSSWTRQKVVRASAVATVGARRDGRRQALVGARLGRAVRLPNARHVAADGPRARALTVLGQKESETAH